MSAVLLITLMMALIFAQILGRYVFNFSIAWSEEMATFAQVWLVMLGAGIAMRRGQHVGIDMMILYFPMWAQRLVKVAAFALVVWFLGVVIVGSTGLIAIGYIVKSTALQVPMAAVYYALPIGMSYFLLEFAIATLPQIFGSQSSDTEAAT
ncbi:TRAP transporter small permease [Pseudoruegeria sp. SK021]|uniref:TRAP transporter small permease n=1 Tax=Pseudoruegeria sp. SK021 TaxID=1933035 RepID=UPI000A328904|nr:TRAP transporter small permease [Pseudoruegeria sp. SK021]